jgi:hypothetical protein
LACLLYSWPACYTLGLPATPGCFALSLLIPLEHKKRSVEELCRGAEKSR